MTEPKKVNIEDRIVDWLLKNRMVVLGAPAVLIVGWVVYLGMSMLQEKNEKTAQADLFRIEVSIEKKMDELAKSEEEARVEYEEKNKNNKKASAFASAEKTPEQLTQHFQNEMAELRRVMTQYKGKKASFMAAIRMAAMAQDYGDLKLAEEKLREVVPNVKESSIYFGLVRGHLALILSDNNKCKEAVEHYDAILAGKKQTAFYAQSLLRKGVCHMNLQEWDKASETFTEIEKDYSNSSASFSAKNFKRMLQLKQSQATEGSGA